MEKIFASSLSGKIVSSDKGEVIGKVNDILFKAETGEITMLLVQPDKALQEKAYPRDENGLITVPFTAINAIGEFVVVSEEKLLRG
ncbi:MAG: PRC-barrel domain-containing protein [Euryarchaeota archaeon]|nr:PRC-barrel domain-containing protein [Euryarchaeota archaeon]